MRIAILGATSQIAKDLIISFSGGIVQHDLLLFARRPERVKKWLDEVDLAHKIPVVAALENFQSQGPFDAIINFVGVGNPVDVATIGASILDVTLKYDEMVLDYLSRNTNCRYIFLSSGAVYGGNFDHPADKNSLAIIPVNCIKPQDLYGVAKMYAECRHRALPHLSIVDIRVFNYFSHTMDVSARFFITDIIRAIQENATFITTSENIIRDYIGPNDFFNLIYLILQSPQTNNVIDCYTKGPIDKISLLEKMQKYYGLKYEIQRKPVGVNATRAKLNYFSRNFRASMFGYSPNLDSLETLKKEFEQMTLQGVIKSANKLNGNLL